MLDKKSRRRKGGGRVLGHVVTASVVAGLLWVGANLSGLDRAAGPGSAPVFGQAVDGLTLVDGSREIRIPDGGWWLALFGDLATKGDLVRAVQRLNEDERARAMSVVVSVTDSPSEIAEFKAANRVTIPIVSASENRDELDRFFSSARLRSHVLVISPTGSVEFSSSFIAYPDVLQLMTKHVGFVPGDNSVDENVPLAVGDTFDPTDLIDARTLRSQKRLEPIPTLWLVVTGDCVTCALDSKLFVFQSIEDRVLERLGDGRRLALLFSPSFNVTNVAEAVGAHGISSGVFVSTASLDGIEHPYSYKPLVPGDNAFVIETDDTGVVELITPFVTFAREVVK